MSAALADKRRDFSLVFFSFYSVQVAKIILLNVTDGTTQPGSEGSVICLTIHLSLVSKILTKLLVQIVYNPGLGERLFIVV